MGLIYTAIPSLNQRQLQHRHPQNRQAASSAQHWISSEDRDMPARDSPMHLSMRIKDSVRHSAQREVSLLTPHNDYLIAMLYSGLLLNLQQLTRQQRKQSDSWEMWRLTQQHIWERVWDWQARQNWRSNLVKEHRH